MWGAQLTWLGYEPPHPFYFRCMYTECTSFGVHTPLLVYVLTGDEGGGGTVVVFLLLRWRYANSWIPKQLPYLLDGRASDVFHSGLPLLSWRTYERKDTRERRDKTGEEERMKERKKTSGACEEGFHHRPVAQCFLSWVIDSLRSQGKERIWLIDR